MKRALQEQAKSSSNGVHEEVWRRLWKLQLPNAEFFFYYYFFL